MNYRLKKESPDFAVTDGPLEGRKFRHGEVYEEIPEGDKGRFEEIKGSGQPSVVSGQLEPGTDNQPPAIETKGGKTK